MSAIPTLETARLVLRPFRAEDAPTVQSLAGDPAVADTTLNIPHPYEDGMAEAWIADHEWCCRRGESIQWAITVRETEALVGACGLVLNRRFNHAELGYWIGAPYWGKGYATEAARALVTYAFEDLDLHKVHAHHFQRNPASGRVLEKAGFIHEGILREHARKGSGYEDLVCFGRLRPA